jgi:hypothetical protein
MCFRPVDRETGRRITPSDLEAHRRTHHFRSPCCLCAHLDGKSYIESKIGIVQLPVQLARASSLSGEYTAECASGRCGYLGEFLDVFPRNTTKPRRIVCLERFYILPILHLRGYPKRGREKIWISFFLKPLSPTRARFTTFAREPGL